MLNVVKTNPDSKDQQTVLGFVEEGFVTLSALQMNTVLRECAYEHQRYIKERHVAVLADLMRRGQWHPKNQIDFALLNGRLILVNGYHRGSAQVRSGKTIEWSIAIHRVKTDADLRALYHSFDTNVAIRGAADLLRANDFAGQHGLPQKVAESLYRAIPYIVSRFELNPKHRNFLVEKQIDLRLQVATDYAKAAARYATCLEVLPAVRRTRFLSGAMMAVGVITLRYQSSTAWEFWAGVANNDGLKRGDPRQALLLDMMTRKAGGNHVYGFAPAIIAWNAFFNDRELRLIKVLESFTPVIDGTPFDGKPIKKAA